MEREVTVTVIVLAGGKSKRMGADKALIEWQGKPLLWQIVERFQRAGFSVIVAGGPYEWAQRLKGLPVPVVADLPAHEGFGPLAGIEAGLLNIKTQPPVTCPVSHVPLIGVIACDLPFADPNLLSWLAGQIGDADAVVPIVDGEPQPLHAVYARSCLPHLVAQLERQDKSVKSFLRRLKVVWVAEEEWQKVADPICLKAHLNEPEDLNRWQISSAATSCHSPFASRHFLSVTRCPVVRCPVVLSFVGFSGSGKTTLIEQLVQRLTAKGYKVGVIKHHHEQRDTGIDVGGKDTWRYRQSGAAITALVAPDGMTLFLPQENLTAEEAVERLTRQLPVDLILVEGFKRSSLPKFIVLPPQMSAEDARQMLSQLLLQIGDPSTIVGLIGQPDVTLAPSPVSPVQLTDLPHFAHDEVERLCEFVEGWASSRF
jgi:molybdopterin-guanine dinucleotide biosynthesis protein